MLGRSASEPDHVFRYGPDADHVCDVRSGGPAAAGRPLVVLLHGGFWRPEYDRTHVRPMTEALAALGWSTVAPEYRRIPGRPDATVADVRAALDEIGRRPELAGLGDGRMVLVGHSAGGHLALHAASAAPDGVSGVLALAPVADLSLAEALRLDTDAVRAFLGGPADGRADLDPVRSPTPPGAVRIVHGAGDGVVPVLLSESYRRRHPAASLTRVPAGHFALIDPAGDAWPTVVDELAALG